MLCALVYRHFREELEHAGFPGRVEGGSAVSMYSVYLRNSILKIHTYVYMHNTFYSKDQRKPKSFCFHKEHSSLHLERRLTQ